MLGYGVSEVWVSCRRYRGRFDIAGAESMLVILSDWSRVCLTTGLLRSILVLAIKDGIIVGSSSTSV